jgi:hypothetical protein
LNKDGPIVVKLLKVLEQLLHKIKTNRQREMINEACGVADGMVLMAADFLLQHSLDANSVLSKMTDRQ